MQHPRWSDETYLTPFGVYLWNSVPALWQCLITCCQPRCQNSTKFRNISEYSKYQISVKQKLSHSPGMLWNNSKTGLKNSLDSGTSRCWTIGQSFTVSGLFRYSALTEWSLRDTNEAPVILVPEWEGATFRKTGNVILVVHDTKTNNVCGELRASLHHIPWS